MSNALKAEIVRRGVLGYLNRQYGRVDLTWHPLFTATRDLWLLLTEGR